MGNLLGPLAAPARGCPLFWARGCSLCIVADKEGPPPVSGPEGPMRRTMPGPCRPPCSGSSGSRVNKEALAASAWCSEAGSAHRSGFSSARGGDTRSGAWDRLCSAAGMPCPEPRPWGGQTCLQGHSEGPAEGRGHRAGAGGTSGEGQEEPPLGSAPTGFFLCSFPQSSWDLGDSS